MRTRTRRRPGSPFPLPGFGGPLLFDSRTSKCWPSRCGSGVSRAASSCAGASASDILLTKVYPAIPGAVVRPSAPVGSLSRSLQTDWLPFDSASLLLFNRASQAGNAALCGPCPCPVLLTPSQLWANHVKVQPLRRRPHVRGSHSDGPKCAWRLASPLPPPRPPCCWRLWPPSAPAMFFKSMTPSPATASWMRQR